MKADKFFSIELVDKFSRIVMLMFEGILLGAVLALAYHNIYAKDIGSTIILISIYCVAFLTYAIFASSKRKAPKIELFKDKIVVILPENKSVCSKRYEFLYSDIEEYKITPLSDLKNLSLENPDKNKFILRVYGFQTLIKLKNGETFKFSNTKKDGVLIYSPDYIYKMLDLKRFVPDFPLVLENFDSKKDTENFEAQFEYYSKNAKNLPLLKNKKYFTCLLLHTLFFFVVAAVLASAFTYVFYFTLGNISRAVMLLWIVFDAFFAIVIPMYLVAFFASFAGNISNKNARLEIESVVKS